jgi:hypothetical protein
MEAAHKWHAHNIMHQTGTHAVKRAHDSGYSILVIILHWIRGVRSMACLAQGVPMHGSAHQVQVMQGWSLNDS